MIALISYVPNALMNVVQELMQDKYRLETTSYNKRYSVVSFLLFVLQFVFVRLGYASYDVWNTRYTSKQLFQFMSWCGAPSYSGWTSSLDLAYPRALRHSGPHSALIASASLAQATQSQLHPNANLQEQSDWFSFLHFFALMQQTLSWQCMPLQTYSLW